MTRRRYRVYSPDRSTGGVPSHATVAAGEAPTVPVDRRGTPRMPAASSPATSRLCCTFSGAFRSPASTAVTARSVLSVRPRGSGSRTPRPRQASSPLTSLVRSRARPSFNRPTRNGTITSMPGVSGRSATRSDRSWARAKASPFPAARTQRSTIGAGSRPGSSTMPSRASVALSVGTSAYASGPPQPPSGRWVDSRYSIRDR